MTDQLPNILNDGVTPPSLDAVRLLRAYLVTDHARAAEIIKSLNETASDRVCSDLVGIYIPMASLAERDAIGSSTEEIHTTFPRVVKRLRGDTLALTEEQVDKLCTAWFSDRRDQVGQMTCGEPTRDLWLHTATSFTTTVGVKDFGPHAFGAYLTMLRKLRSDGSDAGQPWTTMNRGLL